MRVSGHRGGWISGEGRALAVSVLVHAAVLIGAGLVLGQTQAVVPPPPVIALLPPAPEPMAPVEARPSPADAPVQQHIAESAAPRPTPAPPAVKLVESRSDRADKIKPKVVRKQPDPPAPTPTPVEDKASRTAPEESQAAALPEAGQKDDHLNQPSQGAAAARTAPPPSYIGLIRTRLEKQKRYPIAARTARHEGVVVLRFTLRRDGEVEDWAITQSSGVEELDQEVGRMIRKAAPFPAMPDDMTAQHLTLSIPIEFSLQKGE